MRAQSSCHVNPPFSSIIFIIRVLIGGLFGYTVAWGIEGEKFPRRREERRKREERVRGMEIFGQ